MTCDHTRSTEKPASCAKCGHDMGPPPDVKRPLPEHVLEMFGQLAETLEHSGDKSRGQTNTDLDALQLETMRRVLWGEKEYPDSPWRTKHLPREAQEELFDACAYIGGELAKNGRDPDLFNVLVHTYRAYAALRAYEARKKGAP